MRKITLTFLLLGFCLAQVTFAQTFRPIKGWSQEVNERLESFLNTTLTMNERKVSVFDCDGTVFGQVPHYLADEALYQYADEVLKKRNDKQAKEKLAILDRMVKNGDNVGKVYVEDRIHFLAGPTPLEIEQMGYECFVRSS